MKTLLSSQRSIASTNQPLEDFRAELIQGTECLQSGLTTPEHLEFVWQLTAA